MSISRKAQDQTQFPQSYLKCPLINLIDSHFCNVINYNTEGTSFPDSAKISSPRPIYKKKSRHKTENYSPISIFNMTKGHSQVVRP